MNSVRGFFVLFCFTLKMVGVGYANKLNIYCTCGFRKETVSLNGRVELPSIHIAVQLEQILFQNCAFLLTMCWRKVKAPYRRNIFFFFGIAFQNLKENYAYLAKSSFTVPAKNFI